MERIVLLVIYVSGWHICACLPRLYHYVNDAKNWTEAQTYCRQTYTDLATIENTEETNHLINTLSSAGHTSNVWIGLYSPINWKWSDGFKRSGAEYRNWTTTNNEPNFHQGSELCVCTGDEGEWWDERCSKEHPFICNNRTQLDPEFVLVNLSMNYSNAQRYCRENFTDMATVRNDSENQKVKNLVPSGDYAWIGLFRNEVFWSDQSRYFYLNYASVYNPIGSDKVLCGVSSSSGKWKFLSCETSLSFVCYTIPPPVKKQVVKLRLKLEDSSVDMSDPAVRAELLKQFQERLKQGGLSGVTLKWRGQPDGEVFHKEKKKEKD